MHFTDEHEQFRQMVRRFVAEEITVHAEEWESAGIFPAHDLFRKMGRLGLLGLSYPEEYGGGGVDYWYNAILLEELGRSGSAGASLGISVQTDMATPALAKYGSEELKQRYLVPAIAGEMVTSIAVSEPGAGSDVAGIRTRARDDGDAYVVNGSKMWITNGTQADWLCLLARTADEGGYRGMTLMVLPTNSEGFSVSRKLDKLGHRSSDTAILTFDNVRVPKANRIGPEGRGFQVQMEQFQRERLAAVLMGVTGMEKMLRLTANYCQEREAFGQPLLHNQWIYFHLAELLAEVEALRHLAYYCVARYAVGEDMTREASMAKLNAGKLVRRVADTCVQFHGGMGYVEEYPVARYFRDMRLFSIGGGADEVMMEIIAKYEGWSPR